VEDWHLVRHFKAIEFNKPEYMDEDLIFELDTLREFLGRPIKISASFAESGHSKDSQHYKGFAADIKCEGLHPIDFFVAALRFKFNGIGLYPWGIHVDTRILRNGEYKAFWCQIGGVYKPLNRANLAHFLTLF